MKVFIYKFYLKRSVEVSSDHYITTRKANKPSKRAELIPFDGQDMEHYIGLPKIRLLLHDKINEFEAFEVLFDAISFQMEEIRGIDLDSVKPALIKHGIDINQQVEQEVKEYRQTHEILPNISALQIQGIIDRCQLYGVDFLKDLLEFLEQYPMQVDLVKVDEKDDATFQRKVSKLI